MDIVTFIKKNKRYISAILLVSVLLLISRFVASIDFSELRYYLAKMPGMFIGVVLASLMSYTLSTIAWALCMGADAKKIPFTKLFMYRHVGEMLSIFNPTSIVAGEGLKAVILNKKGVSAKHSVSSILLHRVLVMFSGVLLMVVSVLYLTVGKILNGTNVAIIIIVIAALFALGYVLMRYLLHPNLYLAKTVERLKTKTGWSVFSDKLVRSAYEMNEVSSEYYRENQRNFLLAFVLCVVHWIFGAVEFYIILNMLGLDISLVDAVAMEMGVTLFKSIGAIVPGQIGIEEYGNKVMLDAVGIVSNEVWLVVTLMRRGRQLFWLIVAGAFWLIISKQLQIKPNK